MAGGDPLLLQTAHGASLSWKGLSFYPSGNPIEYARRKARAFPPSSRTLYLVPSVGLGHGLADVLSRIPPDSAVLCVEVYQEVMAAAVKHGLPEDARLVIVRTAEEAGVRAALARLGVHRFRRVIEVPLSAGYRLAPEAYARFRRVLEQDLRRYWQNRLTLIAMGSLQVRNLLTNLCLLPSSADFASLWTPLPVIVAGAGPSLERSLPVLARLREKFVLAAVDTALPTLLSSGLRPDLVFAVEAQAVNLGDFIPERDPDMLLACDLSSHPSIARLFPGRTCFFASRFAPLRVFDRLDAAGLKPVAFPALGSVGVTAAHGALRLTAADVFLTGLDFSYPGSRTHARGNPYHLAMLFTALRLHPVGQDSYQALAGRPLISGADKRGRPVATDMVLRSYRDSLEGMMRAVEGRVGDIGVEGLPLGVRAVGVEELESRLAGLPHDGPRLAGGTPGRFTVESLRRFLSSERARLQRAAELLEDPRAPRADAQERRVLLEHIDYAWAHFPDVPDLDAPGAGFLARVRVAALYYCRRLERLASVL